MLTKSLEKKSLKHLRKIVINEKSFILNDFLNCVIAMVLFLKYGKKSRESEDYSTYHS